MTTFLQGTMTDPNAPSVLYADVATGLVANGYTLVDTFVASTNTYKVWKNPASNNPAALDWYLIILYTTTGGGALYFEASEGWDIATHTALRPIYQVSDPSTTGHTGYMDRNLTTGQNISYDNATASPKGSALLTLQTPPHAVVVLQGSRPLAAPITSFGYWIRITNKAVSFIYTGAATVFTYVGLYAIDPYYSGLAAASGHGPSAGIFPLVSARWAADNGDSSYLSRLVGVTRFGGFPTHLRSTDGTYPGSSSTTWSDCFNLIAPLGRSAKRVPSGAQGGYFIMQGVNDGPPSASPVQLEFRVESMSGSSSATEARFIVPMGDLYDCKLLAVDTSVARGDNLAISGDDYVLTSASNAMAIALKAA